MALPVRHFDYIGSGNKWAWAHIITLCWQYIHTFSYQVWSFPSFSIQGLHYPVSQPLSRNVQINPLKPPTLKDFPTKEG